MPLNTLPQTRHEDAGVESPHIPSTAMSSGTNSSSSSSANTASTSMSAACNTPGHGQGTTQELRTASARSAVSMPTLGNLMASLNIRALLVTANCCSAQITWFMNAIITKSIQMHTLLCFLLYKLLKHTFSNALHVSQQCYGFLTVFVSLSTCFFCPVLRLYSS